MRFESLNQLDSGLERSWDVIVVGAGHNGLTAAAYLARAGLDVLVLERRDRIGGACTIEEPWPGYRVSPCAYVLGLLHEQVVSDLGLERRGLRVTIFDPQIYVPLGDGLAFFEWNDAERTLSSLDSWAPGERAGMAAMHEIEDHIYRAIRGDGDAWDDLWLRIDPPSADEVRSRLVEEAARAVFEDSVVEYLHRYLSDERLIDAIAGQGVIGETASPLDRGTAWIRLHHSLGRVGGTEGSWGLVHGGIGKVSFALADAAKEAGARIVTNAAVAEIRPGIGVVLEDESLLRSKVVMSNADPERTAHLAGEGQEQSTIVGASAKVNFALTAPPGFPHAESHTSMVNVGASVDLLHESATSARRGVLSDRLWAELYTQSVIDDSVVPEGKHVLSCFVQYVPYHLKGGWDGVRRAAVIDRISDEIERHAPGFRQLIEHAEVSVPTDIEEKIGLTGGHIFQGDCLPERMWSNRPDYQTPFEGVYLCGAGTHPGGSVIAVNGRNAAMRVLRDYD